MNRYIMFGRGICEKYQSRDETFPERKGEGNLVSRLVLSPNKLELMPVLDFFGVHSKNDRFGSEVDPIYVDIIIKNCTSIQAWDRFNVYKIYMSIYKSNFFLIVYFDFIDVLHVDNIFDKMILIKQLDSNYESIIHFNEYLHVFADIILSLLSLEHHKHRLISLITAPLQTLRNIK